MMWRLDVHVHDRECARLSEKAAREFARAISLAPVSCCQIRPVKQKKITMPCMGRSKTAKQLFFSRLYLEKKGSGRMSIRRVAS